jgi:hypothetical protein
MLLKLKAKKIEEQSFWMKKTFDNLFYHFIVNMSGCVDFEPQTGLFAILI